MTPIPAVHEEPLEVSSTTFLATICACQTSRDLGVALEAVTNAFQAGKLARNSVEELSCLAADRGRYLQEPAQFDLHRQAGGSESPTVAISAEQLLNRDAPCYCCGSVGWWYSAGRQVCRVCHPPAFHLEGRKAA